MATSTYEIKALSSKEKEVRLELKIISPDEYYFYIKKNFVLQLLWDAAQQSNDASISEAISMDQILDSEWVLANERKFIKSVEITETKDYPQQSQIAKMTREDFDNFRKEHGIPSAIYKITLTDAQWSEHIKTGATWKSAAYDLEE